MRVRGPSTARRITAWLTQVLVVFSTAVVSVGGLAPSASAASTSSQMPLFNTGCPAGGDDARGAATFTLGNDGRIQVDGEVAAGLADATYSARLFTACGGWAYTDGTVSTDSSGNASFSFTVDRGLFDPPAGTQVGLQLVYPPDADNGHAFGNLELLTTGSWTVPRADSLFGTNLIANPDAEAGPGSADGCKVGFIPGWTSFGNFTVVNYGITTPIDSCVPSYTSPDPANGAPPDHGTNLFSGGRYLKDGVVDNVGSPVCASADPPNPDANHTCATQTIDLSSAAADIDRGGVTADLSGWLGGRDAQDDNAILSAQFLDAQGNVLDPAISIGPVLASGRDNTMKLVYRAAKGTVPVGARSIFLRLDMTHTGTTY